MNLRAANLGSRREQGLSMIEMMVTVALLGVIVVGLMAMFDQTRKAFNAGTANVDYQDAGRTALEVISRNLQQMAPAKPGVLFANSINTAVGNTFVRSPLLGTNLLNFYSDFEPKINLNDSKLQSFNGDFITNVMQRVLFVTQLNQTWSAVGYRVDPNMAVSGVGTLYEYRATGPVGGPTSADPSIIDDFLTDTNVLNATNALNPVIDGVVDFRLRTYNPYGIEITSSSPNVMVFPDGTLPTALGYAFGSNAVPAYVEIELTVLETPTLRTFESLGLNNRATFISNHVGQMHVFKQRVTIPSLDRAAYP
jgi:prepilin-type N-terminal cleavage/methylation domain-containing protein